MRPDPKFGYHWIWMLPVALALELQYVVVDKYQTIKYNRKIKRIVKENPDIAELRKLSGQDKCQKKTSGELAEKQNEQRS